jgi:outer membrane protein assembly factor BamB
MVLFCCKKDVEVVLTPSPSEEKIQVVWRKSLLPSKSESYSMSPVISDNWVIFSNMLFRNASNFAQLLFLNKISGDSLNTWDEFAASPNFISWEEQQKIDDYLFLSHPKYLHCLSLSTGSSIWSSQFESDQGSGLCYINNGYLYRFFGSNGYLPNLSGTLIRSPLDHEDWQQVYSYTADDGYSVGFSCMLSTFLDNGDEVLLFKNRQWHFDSMQGRMDVFAYNLSADSLLWRNKGLEKWDGGVIPMQVKDSLVFCPGGGLLYALNLYTGEKVWEFNYAEKSPGNHFGYGDIFINGPFLLVKPSGDELFCLTAETGRLNWWRENRGWTMKGRFTHFENKLFYIADADLIIIDDYTGERLLKEDQQEHLGKLTGDVRIDPATRLMYMANYHEALCVKIPEGL